MPELREIMPVIVLVSLGAILLVSISEQWTANDLAEQEHQLEYLECRPLSSFGDVEAIAGPAEIFSYEGEEWLRMTGVGSLSIKTAKGTDTYKIGNAKLGLVLITGQSNAQVYSNPQYFTTPYTIAPGNVFIFGTESPATSTLGCAAIPETVAQSKILDLVKPDGTLRISQMYPTFCKDWLKESGHRILVLNTAIGGKAISEWDIPTGRCAAWMTTATDYLKKAIEEDGHIDVEPLGVVWSQGESDYRNTEEYYFDKFKTLVGRLESGAWGYEYPCVMTSVPRYPGISDPIPPALAQMRLAAEDDTVILASTLALEFGPVAPEEVMRPDGIHYSQKAYGWFGEAFARALAIEEGHVPVAETIVFTKDLGTVEELPQTVTAYGTSGAAFELQVSWTESGGSYTGELSGNPAGTRIMEGLAASATLAVEEEEAEPETP